MNATVSEKGQITIPKPLRDRLGIRPGEILDVREEAGRLVATKPTQAAARGGAFDWLSEEPDLYSATDGEPIPIRARPRR